jgi:hypothetical protein
MGSDLPTVSDYRSYRTYPVGRPRQFNPSRSLMRFAKNSGDKRRDVADRGGATCGSYLRLHRTFEADHHGAVRIADRLTTPFLENRIVFFVTDHHEYTKIERGQLTSLERPKGVDRIRFDPRCGGLDLVVVTQWGNESMWIRIAVELRIECVGFGWPGDENQRRQETRDAQRWDERLHD